MAASVLIDNRNYGTSRFGPNDIYYNEKIASSSPVPKETFKEICVVKSINKAKFPVYLICSKQTKQNYAMKVFPFKNNKPHSYFKNEIRFSGLNHPNIVKTVHIEPEKDTISKGIPTKVSYTIMEYASNGDFFDFVMNYGTKTDEKIARTYFRQLIEGLEYLHNNGISHMDVKLENLLLGEDYQLKLTDFDLSYIDKDQKVLSKGTKFYRAPEVMKGVCKNTRASDIYSAAIVLFTMKTKGILAHSENNLIGGTNFSELLHNNDPKFWEKHCEIQKKDKIYFENEFKELFIAMTRPKPEERITIEEIKKSEWYNGPYYSPEELKARVERIKH